MAEHLLVFEPRTEGHHLGWLRFICEDLLSGGYRLTVAADLRRETREHVEDHLKGLLAEIRLVPARNERGRPLERNMTDTMVILLETSAADRLFLPALDEVASTWWRRGAVGLLPPQELRGRAGGIYHRPRFWISPKWSPNALLKRIGFGRLLGRGCLAQVLFVDEYLAAEVRHRYPSTPIFFLPDPCPSGYDAEQQDARQRLGLPPKKMVFLFYGTGARRKGLHIAVEAFLGLPPDQPAFLLCAGRQNTEGKIRRDLDQLVREGSACVIDRYVSEAEEKLLFAAADVVLLPYVGHFGASGVLSRATAAGKLVIASEEQLLGRLTRERGLGLLFPPGDAGALRQRILTAADMTLEESRRFRRAAAEYATRYSRGAFRSALLESLAFRNLAACHSKAEIEEENRQAKTSVIRPPKDLE